MEGATPIAEPAVFRQVHMTEQTLHLLGGHALSLPDGHPVRAAIRLLLHRAARSPVYVPRVETIETAHENAADAAGLRAAA